MDARNQRGEHYDAIIVGSGFGGSVMAYRLAEAGLRVCLLERGKAYPPGSFPRSPYAMRHNFWDPSQGMHGMFNLWSFRGLGGVVSSGLGGGSLIYANVLLRKDEKTFVHEDLQNGGYEYWPVNREDLDPHYDLVERMMAVQRYPLDQAPYASTAKTLAMKLAAERLGMAGDWQLPPLAVTFANPGEAPVPGEPIKEEFPNLHGHTRTTCRLCGECDIGCNYGSKNTLDYTYLSAAKRHGADLRTRAEVKEFWPAEGGGFVVQYVDYTDTPEDVPRESSSEQLPRTTLTADRLVLAAGTFGSTYLLLKMREKHFPALGGALGSHFCGNGDLLGFLLKCGDSSTGKRLPRVLDGGHGPVITSALHFRGEEEGGTGRGYYVQDAGYPEFFNWLFEGAQQLAILKRGARLAGRIVKGWMGLTRDSDVSEEIAEVLGQCLGSATSLPLLAMGRDTPNGHMTLTDGMLGIDWRVRGSKPYFDRVHQSMKDIADALEGELVQNPLSYLSRVITVHPLGGCPMGRTPEEGVVDANGECFQYPGLYVADGAVMPGPTGPNPSLTIAALADRFADHLIAQSSRPVSPAPERRNEEESAWEHAQPT